MPLQPRIVDLDRGYYIDLDEDDKTLGDYEIDRYCTAVKFEKSLFDVKGVRPRSILGHFCLQHRSESVSSGLHLRRRLLG